MKKILLFNRTPKCKGGDMLTLMFGGEPKEEWQTSDSEGVLQFHSAVDNITEAAKVIGKYPFAQWVVFEATELKLQQKAFIGGIPVAEL